MRIGAEMFSRRTDSCGLSMPRVSQSRTYCVHHVLCCALPCSTIRLLTEQSSSFHGLPELMFERAVRIEEKVVGLAHVMLRNTTM